MSEIEQLLLDSIENDFENVNFDNITDYGTIKEMVYNYKTESEYGLNDLELRLLFNKFPNLDKEKYNKSFVGHTFTRINNKNVYYHCDVLQSIYIATR